MGATTGSFRRQRRRWHFANVTFDEGSWSLQVGEAVPALEAKPLELLHELLLHAGEVVGKDELLEAVWPGVVVVEASLPTAVSKLRKALGDDAGRIVQTVPRIGYRLAVPVSVENVAAPLVPRFDFQPGDPVPGRPQWRLREALGDSGAADVWRATHEKTGAARVFKFADTPERLRGLRREAAIARLLLAGLGEEGPFTPLLEWNFEAAPYWIESRDGGCSLLDWAAGHGGLRTIDPARRLAVARDLARALAAVHGLGVLHKDLKPGNVLIEEREDGGFRIRLADFGSGQVLDAQILHAHAITAHAADFAGDPDSSRSGTARYRAPELVGTALSTVRSDVYALGLILFQLVVGDFDASLAPGWEAVVADPVLRADIAAGAAGDPQQRLASAAALAERLETLDQRRAEAERMAERDAHLAALQRERERRSARQPWMRAAAVAAGIGIVATSAAALVAWKEGDHARHQAEIAQASYDFLSTDLLRRADPANGDGSQETLAEAAKRAAVEIDRRFEKEPLVAARLHATLAKAFQERNDVAAARGEFAAADRQFARARATDSEEATLSRLAHAQSEASSFQADGVRAAKAIVAQERRRLGPAADRGRIGYALAKAEGLSDYFGDLEASRKAYERALALVAADPSLADTPRDAMRLRTIHALLLMRIGKAKDAEAEMRDVVARDTALFGADGADTLNARQNLANALAIQKRYDEAAAAFRELLPLFERRYGPDHRLTLALLSGLGDALSATGHYDEAVPYAERTWRAAARTSGPTSWQALGGQLDVGVYRCRGGHAREGLENLRTGLAEVEKTFGHDYPLAHAARYYAAECLIDNGRHAEAASLLRDSDPAKIAELVPDQPWPAEIALAQAEIALADGDRDRAQKLFDASGSAFADSVAGSYEQRRVQRLGRLLSANR